ncbi:hypothetical protein AOL_s00188g112 [Orbilia oligospora ATCC 24927]|uniref:Uncharacterized protein n=2 Tax=Orbilia oligospora TaxID=2813651 RepID=G1XQA1_ARTOA|nr:hypothetical protein AOL_s00188g112 [Orbilia oligospora ATCC 24927]EGX44774.1 hypothetical protein AOL_s00188g112 [Orbilia oligospora ATCC 24927]KAF3275038.1 hypothetical protein TWF970_007481 [Orbilia oligospora]
MFHSRKTKNIKDLPAFSSLKAQATLATKKVAEKPEVKETSAQKRKLEALSEDNDPNPAKRIRRARELVAKLKALNEKGPKALVDMGNPPVTPQNKVLGALKIWDYSPPKTTESDKAIRLLVEERMNNEAKCQGLPERTRAIVLEARVHAEKKKAKVEELRARRENAQRWASFRSRLERGRLPADRHLRGPLLVGERRVTRGRVDQGGLEKDVQDILKRWRGSAVVEGASNAPASPREGRGAVERRKKGEMVGRVSDELTKVKKELIESKTRACEAKKARLIGARDEILAATEQVKKDLEEFKARSRPGQVRAATRTVKANIVRLTAKYEALMAEHERAFDEVVKAERELVELRGKVAKLPTGNPGVVGEFAEGILRSSTKTVEDLGEKEKEGLRKQLKGEKRALRSLQRR